MEKLNLPEYQHRIRENNSKTEIYDLIRRKFVALTPEEWVRQNFVLFLQDQLGYLASRMALERSLTLNGLTKRTDLVIYNDKLEPLMIVEFKAPKVKITQDVFDQAARYNMRLKVDYLLVTNGLSHFCCKVNHQTQQIDFLQEIPNYNQIRNTNEQP